MSLYATIGLLNQVADVVNYSTGTLSDGSPSLVVDTTVLSVPCRVMVNSSREGIEQGRLLGRAQYVGWFVRQMPSGTNVSLVPRTTVTLGSVSYEVKSPPRLVAGDASPIQEVDLEVKS